MRTRAGGGHEPDEDEQAELVELWQASRMEAPSEDHGARIGWVVEQFLRRHAYAAPVYARTWIRRWADANLIGSGTLGGGPDRSPPRAHGVESILPRSSRPRQGATLGGPPPAAHGVESILPRSSRRRQGVDAVLPKSVMEREIRAASTGRGAVESTPVESVRPYAPGTEVLLPDGTSGIATPYFQGGAWTGAYIVRQGGREDQWRHEQVWPI